MNLDFLPGHRFGQLIVDVPLGAERRGIIWRCRCDCGTVLQVPASALRTGRRRHCGCARRKAVATADTTKICTGCGADLPLASFTTNRRAKYGRDHRCRACRAAEKQQRNAAKRSAT